MPSWAYSTRHSRRRMYIVRRCGELVAHIQNTNTQYNLPAFGKKLSRKYNHHLKWAIKEAAILKLRSSSQAKGRVAKYTRKYKKGKPLGIFTRKLGRAIYFMLKNIEAFSMKRFFAQ